MSRFKKDSRIGAFSYELCEIFLVQFIYFALMFENIFEQIKSAVIPSKEKFFIIGLVRCHPRVDFFYFTASSAVIPKCMRTFLTEI